MVPQAHFSYPFLTATAVSVAVGYQFNAWEVFTILFSSVLPDIDWFFLGSRRIHHHNYLSHAPLFYFLLIGLASYFLPLNIILFSLFGITSHFMMDTLLSGDGIHWLYPFSRKKILLTEYVKGVHGDEGLVLYKRLPIYKMDNFAFIIVVILLVFI